jgi:WD40 repeat protein
MMAMLRRWRQRLTGPIGRRLFLALALAGLWAGWVALPPRSLVAWDTSIEPIVGVEFSPDGTRLLAITTAGQNQFLLRLWDAATGRELVSLPGSDLLPLSQFSPEGRWLVAQVRPGVISIHDTGDGRLRHQITLLAGHDPADAQVDDLQITRDGRTLAAYVKRNPPEVQLWDLEAGRLNATIVGAITPMAFNPDGRTLATSLSRANPGDMTESRLRLWDVASGRDVTSLRDLPHTETGAIAFSPDGRLLAVGGQSGIGVWELTSGRLRARLGTRDVPWRMEISPDGRFLVVRNLRLPVEGAWEPDVVWDLSQKPPCAIDPLLTEGQAPFHGHDFPVFDRVGRRFLVPGWREGTVAVFDAVTLARAGEYPAMPHLGDLALSPQGHLLAVRELPFRMTPARWDLWFEEWFGRPPPWRPNQESIHFYDLATGASRGRVPTDTPLFTPSFLNPPWNDHVGSLLGFSPDGQSLWSYGLSAEGAGDKARLRVRQWAVPSRWPPAWLIGVAALGVLLAVVDGWHARRQRRTAVRP